MSEWRSTDTAPRDGTWILALFSDHARVVRWRSGPDHNQRYMKRQTEFWSSGYYRHGEPTHWMPLPASPEGHSA